MLVITDAPIERETETGDDPLVIALLPFRLNAIALCEAEHIIRRCHVGGKGAMELGW